MTAGMECMCGSAIYLMTTGISKSQALIVLSSEVVTNRRFSSTNVIVFTGPRCWSYSCVISPEFMSYCGSRISRRYSPCRTLTCMIFLSDIPARKMFCCSGWNRTTYGIFPLLNLFRHWPVSVSQSFIWRS